MMYSGYSANLMCMNDACIEDTEASLTYVMCTHQLV